MLKDLSKATVADVNAMSMDAQLDDKDNVIFDHNNYWEKDGL